MFISLSMVLHLQSWRLTWEWGRMCHPNLQVIWSCTHVQVRMAQLYTDIEGRIHTARIKIWILSLLHDLWAHLQRRDRHTCHILDEIGDVLRKACDYNSGAMHLAWAAQVMRREMFERKFSLCGSFKEGFQRNAVSQSLLVMVNICFRRAQTSSIKLRLQPVKWYHFPYRTPKVQQCETCMCCRFLWCCLPQLRITTSTLHCYENPWYHIQGKSYWHIHQFWDVWFI